MAADAPAAGLDDLPYVASFTPELSPDWLDLVAAIGGVGSPRKDEPFRWCDLGCGLGLAGVTYAALNPDAVFTAIDARVDHVAAADRLRRAAGVDNLSVHARRFDDTGDLHLPPQHYIVAHGVYSWIDDASLDALYACIDRHLAPGGLLYLSYNAMPGWAADATFQHLLGAIAAGTPGATLDRFSRSAAAVQRLVDSGGGALTRTVAGAEWLAYLERQEAAYLPHEYLTPGWRASYVDDVRRAMASIGLAPVGTATIEENFDALVLTETQRHALASIDDPNTRELARDYLLDQRFRRDVYARAPRRLNRDEQRRALLERPFALLRPTRLVDLTVPTPRGQVSCDTSATRHLVNALASGPKRLVDCAGSGIDIDALVSGMLMLCCAHMAWPASAAAPDVTRLNDALEREAGTADAVYRVVPRATALPLRPSLLADARAGVEMNADAAALAAFFQLR